MADGGEKKPAPVRKITESANDTAVKAELNNIFRTQAEQSPFLRTLSLGNQADWSNLPAPAVDFGQDGEGAFSKAVPFVPFGNVVMDDNSITDKHVAFGDEKKDDKGIRKTQTFAGSLSEVDRHSDHSEISYPHFHHVISRHRPSRSRKVTTESKLPTHLESDERKPDHDDKEQDEKKDVGKPVKIFNIGQGPSDTETDHDELEKEEKKKGKRKHRHSISHRSHFTEGELELRRAKGSELAMEDYDAINKMGESSDENLDRRDLEDTYHRRFDHMSAIERHKIPKRKGSRQYVSISGPTKFGADQEKFMDAMYPDEAAKDHIILDHTPHPIFVEMDELHDTVWVETSRWIKYEEAREEGSERWGKPHVSSLSFHSLLNLRLHLERGVILLDLEARDMTNLLFNIVEQFNLVGLLEDEKKSEILRILLFRHRYVEQEHHQGVVGGLKRNLSWKHMGQDTRKASSAADIKTLEEGSSRKDSFGAAHSLAEAMLSLSGTALNEDLLENIKARYPILNRMPDDVEGVLTLCGAMECLKQPLVAFVRLAQGQKFKQCLEVPIPVRFVIVILTPKPSPYMDCHPWMIIHG